MAKKKKNRPVSYYEAEEQRGHIVSFDEAETLHGERETQRKKEKAEKDKEKKTFSSFMDKTVGDKPLTVSQQKIFTALKGDKLQDPKKTMPGFKYEQAASGRKSEYAVGREPKERQLTGPIATGKQAQKNLDAYLKRKKEEREAAISQNTKYWKDYSRDAQNVGMPEVAYASKMIYDTPVTEEQKKKSGDANKARNDKLNAYLEGLSQNKPVQKQQNPAGVSFKQASADAQWEKFKNGQVKGIPGLKQTEHVAGDQKELTPQTYRDFMGDVWGGIQRGEYDKGDEYRYWSDDKLMQAAHEKKVQANANERDTEQKFITNMERQPGAIVAPMLQEQGVTLDPGGFFKNTLPGLFTEEDLQDRDYVHRIVYNNLVGDYDGEAYDMLPDDQKARYDAIMDEALDAASNQTMEDIETQGYTQELGNMAHETQKLRAEQEKYEGVLSARQTVSELTNNAPQGEFKPLEENHTGKSGTILQRAADNGRTIKDEADKAYWEIRDQQSQWYGMSTAQQMEYLEKAGIQSGNGGGLAGSLQDTVKAQGAYYVFMTPEQVDTFNKYYLSGDKDSAMAFLTALKQTGYLDAAAANYRNEVAKENAQGKYGGLYGLATVPDQILTGFTGTIGTAGAYFGNKDLQNPNNTLWTHQREIQTTRGTRAEVLGTGAQQLLKQAQMLPVRLYGNKNLEQIADIASDYTSQWIKEPVKFMTNVAYSMLDNLAAMGVGKLFFGGNTKKQVDNAMRMVQFIMSSEATSNTMARYLDDGYEPTEAAMYAVGDGVIEWVTERVSLEQIMKPDVKALLGNGKGLGKYLFKASVAEGSEEIAADGLNLVLDWVLSIANNHKTEIEKRRDEYIAAGMDPDEALNKAWGDKVKEIGLSGLAGAVSGLGLSGSRIATNAVSKISSGKAINTNKLQYNGMNSQQAMVDLAQNMPENSQSAQQAKEIARMMEKGEKISNQQMGTLAQTLQMEASETLERAENGEDVSIDDVERSMKTLRSVAEIVSQQQESKPISEMDRKNNLHLASQEEVDQMEARGMKRTGSRTEVVYDGTFRNINKIEATKNADGEIMFRLDGVSDPVSAKEIQATDFNTAQIIRAAAENANFYSAEFANKMLQAQESGQIRDISQFMTDAMKLRLSAYAGMEMPKVDMNQGMAQELFMQSMQEHAQNRAAQVENGNRKQTGRATFQGAEYGTKEFNQKIDSLHLNRSQRAQIDAIAAIAQRAGIEVTFMDLAETEKQARAMGDKSDAKGLYGWENRNGININIEGINFGNIEGQSHNMAVTFGHEMTHWLQRNSMQGYARLEQFVMRTFAEKLGTNRLMQRINTIMQTQDINLEDAMSELVADSCDQILGDEQVMQHIQQTDQSLFKQVQGFVQDLVGRVKAAISGLTFKDSASLEARMMRSILKSTNEMAKIWLGAYDEAISQAIDKTDVYHATDTVRKSKADTSYLQLINDGNMKAAKQIVEKAARGHRYTDHGFHGTNAFGFTEADVDGSQGQFFVAYSLDLAGTYTHLQSLKNISESKIETMSETGLAELAQAVTTEAEEGVQAVRYNEDSKLFEVKLDTGETAVYTKAEIQEMLNEFIEEDQQLNEGERSKALETLHQGIYDLYLRPGKQLVVDAHGSSWRNIEFHLEDYGSSWEAEFGSIPEQRGWTTRSIAQWARDNGYNSVRINNVIDNGYQSSYKGGGDIGIFFNANDIKSADTVTVDNDGKVIMPSERFNDQEKDMRFSKSMWTTSEGKKWSGYEYLSITDNGVFRVDSKGNRTELTGDAKEYALAWKQGNTAKMEQLLLKKASEIEGITLYKTPRMYSTEMDRWVANEIKTGNKQAIAIAAQQMAEKVPENAALIPMPPRSGKVNANTDTMLLAQEISKLTGNPVINALEGNERDSRQADKGKPKSQQMTAEDLGFRQTQAIPEGTIPYFIDNLIAAGVTAKAAHDAFGQGITLAYAKSTLSADAGLKNAEPTFYDKNKQFLISLDDRMDMSKKGFQGTKFSKAETHTEAQEKYKNADLINDESVYSYDFLKNMPDMKVQKETDQKRYTDKNGLLNRDKLREVAMENAKENGTELPNNRGVAVKNNYTGRNLVITPDGATHSTTYDNKNVNIRNARASAVIGDLAKNAIPINSLTQEKDQHHGTYAMAAPMISEDGKHTSIAVLTVDELTGNVLGTDVYDQLHSVSVREKNEAGLEAETASPSSQFHKGDTGITRSEISIAELLKVINSTHKGLLSKDVLANLGEEKPTKGYWAEQARFSKAQMDPQQQELSQAWQDARDEADNMRQQLDAMKPEADAWVNKIMDAEKNGTRDAVMDEYKEWEKGYVAAQDALYEANRKYKAAVQAYDDYIEQRDVAEEEKQIKESGLTEKEYRRKQAADEFGYTTDFREAGYLLPNGKMLNFSGEKGRHYGSRGEDHRGIGRIYASSRYQGGAAMMKFMNDGNIRVMAETPGVDMISSIEPTAEQYDQIRNMARRFAGEEYFNVDFTDKDGYTVANLEYDGRVNPSRVVNDIKNFYQTGEAREQSVVDQFHFSKYTEESMDVNAWLAGATASTFQTEDERVMWQAWKDLRMKISLSLKRQLMYRDQIKALEAKTELSAEERDQLTTLQNKLEVQQQKMERLENELQQVTNSDGYAGMMWRQNVVLSDFIQGKTQDQVRQTVEQMLKEVSKARTEIQKQTEELNKLAETQAVKTMQSFFGKSSLGKMASMLRKFYNSSISKTEVESRLAEMAMKQARGESITDECMALAVDLVDKIRGIRSESLENLRGTTFIIGESLAKELKAENTSLKEIRSAVKGSGVQFVTSQKSQTGAVDKHSRISEQWEELRAKDGSLPDVSDMSEIEKLHTIVDFIANTMEKSTGAQQLGIDMDEAALFVRSAVGNVTTYLVDNPQARGQIENLMKQIRDLSNKTGQIAGNMETLNKQMEEVENAGIKAKGWTTVLQRDVGDAINYYNKMAKLAAEKEKRYVKEQIIDQLKSENTAKLIRQQREYEEKMRNDRKARGIAEDNKILRNKIHTVASRMGTRLFAETDQKNVPEETKPLVRMVLGMLEKHDSIYRHIMLYNRKQLINIQQRLEKMNAVYGPFDFDEDLNWLIVNPGPDQDATARDAVVQALVDIETGMLEYRNAEGHGLMTLEDRKNALIKVQEAVSTIWNVVQARNELEINGRRMQVIDLAMQMAEEMEGREYKGERTGKRGLFNEQVAGKVGYGNLTPEYFFKNLKNKAMSILKKGLDIAENRGGLEAYKAKQRVAQIVKDTHYGTWDGQEKHEVAVSGKRTVTMTTEQIMALYATWKRESNALRPDETSHLLHGGYMLNVNRAEMKNGRVKMDQRPIRMTKDNLINLSSYLTEDQKAWVDQIVDYMSGDLAKLGNEASMKMYGIKKFTEQYYFPIKSWSGVLNKRSDAGVQNQNENRAAQQSFSKRVRNNANNTIEIGDFTATAMKHIAGMINYNSVAPAIENMNKVLNQQLHFGQKTEEYDDSYKMNMRAMFAEKYGMLASNYLARFMQDMNGGIAQQAEKSLKETLLTTFRKGAVAGSLSVALQQPLSYIRAAMMINPKYLTQAILPTHWGRIHDEMLKYSGLAVIKDMGRFDMNQGRSMIDYITPEESMSKAKQIKEKAVDLSTKLPEIMDQITWGRLWIACKLETQAKNPELDPGSEEFMQTVAERFNEMVRRTQVYDSVMVKSQNMRSQNYAVKSMTSFMAEPTLSLNVLADAVRNFNEKGGKTVAAKAGATFILSAAAQALFKAIMASGRSPEEKKTWLEQFLTKWFSLFMGEVNPLTLVPGFSDIIEALKYGEISDDAMSVIGKLKNIILTTIKWAGGKSADHYRNFEDTIGQIGQIFTGVPLKNLMRDGRAIYNFFSQPYAKRDTSGAVLKYGMIDAAANLDNIMGTLNFYLTKAGIGYGTTSDDYYKRIYAAEKTGNTKAAEDMKEYLLLGKGLKEESINSALRKLYKKDEDLTSEEKLEAQREYGLKDTSGYVLDEFRAGNLTRKEAEKLYRQERPDASDKDVLKALDKIEWEKKGNDPEGYTNYTPLYAAIDTNKSDNIREAARHMMENGYTQKEIKTQLKTKYKKAYLEATGAERTKLEDALTKAYKAIGLTAEEALKIIHSWKK